MYRILLVMTWGLGLVLSGSSFAESTSPEIKPGQWSTIVAVLDNAENHYLLRTTVNDDSETCLTQLAAVGAKVREGNGIVWTNSRKSMISFEKKSGYAEVGVKVLELRCVLEPFTPGIVRFF
jgi:hypothetical protein